MIDKKQLIEIKNKPPIFIVGCQRSGTSFLYRAMSEVLDIGIGRDNTLFLNLYRGIAQYGDLSQDENLWKLLSEIEASPVFKKRFKGLHINNEDFIDALEKREYPDIVRSIYAYWALKQGKTRWGGKTPDYTAQLTPLARLLPDVKIIHVVRDGRDVALSLFERPWGPKDIYVAARYWKARVLLGAAGKELPEGRFYEIQYESFLAEPEEHFKKLLKFVEVDDLAMKNTMQRFSEKVAPKIMSNNSFKWKKKMRASAIRVFEVVAGDELKRFGYEIVNKNYQENEISTFSKAYHHLHNLFVKFVRGHIFRTLMKRGLHYKY